MGKFSRHPNLAVMMRGAFAPGLVCLVLGIVFFSGINSMSPLSRRYVLIGGKGGLQHRYRTLHGKIPFSWRKALGCVYDKKHRRVYRLKYRIIKVNGKLALSVCRRCYKKKSKLGKIVFIKGLRYKYVRRHGRIILVRYRRIKHRVTKRVGKIVYRRGVKYIYVRRRGRIVLVRYRRTRPKIRPRPGRIIVRRGVKYIYVKNRYGRLVLIRYRRPRAGRIVVRRGVKYIYVKRRGRLVLIRYVRPRAGRIVVRRGVKYIYVKRRDGRLVLIRYKTEYRTEQLTQIFKNGRWITVTAEEARRYMRNQGKRMTQIFINGKWVTVTAAEAKRYMKMQTQRMTQIFVNGKWITVTPKEAKRY